MLETCSSEIPFSQRIFQLHLLMRFILDSCVMPSKSIKVLKDLYATIEQERKRNRERAHVSPPIRL